MSNGFAIKTNLQVAIITEVTSEVTAPTGWYLAVMLQKIWYLPKRIKLGTGFVTLTR